MQPQSLYIHIPFCSRKCLFCSFVIAVGQEHRRDEYIHALIAEMKIYQGRKIKTIYFGGGTPSKLDERHLEILMKAISNNFLLERDIEITLEANPESIDLPKAKFLKSLGFNRISLGVQTMRDQYLKFLGREHDAAKAIEAFENLCESGFHNINLDLMYGFPGQTKEELEEDTRSIAAFGSKHLSLYTLTIEPNSRFHAQQMKLDDDDKLAQHYLLIARVLSEYGFNQYEISNFARPGFESVHNKNYWLGEPYIAVGMGAHGFNGKRRYWNVTRLQEYLQRVAEGKDLVEGYEDLTEYQLVMERVLFGLRMNQGVAAALLPADKLKQVQEWVKDGFLVFEDGHYKTTQRGRLVLDELSSRLI